MPDKPVVLEVVEQLPDLDLDSLHYRYGLLIIKLWNLIGSEVGSCPFMGILVFYLLYKLIA